MEPRREKYRARDERASAPSLAMRSSSSRVRDGEEKEERGEGGGKKDEETLGKSHTFSHAISARPGR